MSSLLRAARALRAPTAGLRPWRPGVVAGAYPQRADLRPPLALRAARALWGALALPRAATRRDVARLAARVARAAPGAAELSEAAFDAALRELRLALARAGPCPELELRGFALVREAARRVLGTPHYDVQLYGGWVMARGGLAEMETGEGKTLTAVLPAALAALAGTPVHVVTANDYLVERDASALRPLYERLGLSVGAVLEARAEPAARRAAYACDVTYVTNKQLAFDYLRDRVQGAGAQRLAQQLGSEPGEPPLLRGLCLALLDEADSSLIDDAGTPLILSRPGAPVDPAALRTARRLAAALEPGTHYRLDARRQRAELAAAGHERLAELGRGLQGALAGPRRRAEWVELALAAEQLFEEGRHYLVREGALQLVDASTGRRSPDRAFQGPLQALLESKHGLALSAQRETLTRITYQSFFRRYLRLAGMTGTAREVARELWNVYGLRSVSVPPRLPSQRRALGLRVLATAEAKWSAAVARIGELHAAGRPVLAGTASVADAEQLSAQLRSAGLAHQLLTARQDAQEAQQIARAGEPGQITVATQLAGRGTDIRLAAPAARAGGLAVIATELAEARRIDRQLFGRCARQGAPGSWEQLASLQDRVASGARAPLLSALASARLPGLHSLMRAAQRAEERRSALARRRLQAQERELEKLLAFSSES